MLSRRLFQSIRRLGSLNAYTDRTHTCGELGIQNEGQRVIVTGWLAFKRMDRFIVLRDAYGTVQATVAASSDLCKTIKDLPYESVVKVEGRVKNRGENRNEKMETGDVEIDISHLTVLNRVESVLPLDPNGNAQEKTRLRYRYLDIRGNRMQKSLRLRSQLVHNIRRFLVEQRGFVDVETPTLFRRTPGGAAEFLVPAAAPNKGSCYSLPQSPQQFKQLLMVGGIDRYFQIARCYRDEGSKGDRQPEFTQVDLEVSFTDQNGIMQLVEDMILSAWPETMSDLKPSSPFPRLSFDSAMLLYGSDKPDMRIDWKIEDCTEMLAGLRPSGPAPSSDWSARLIVCRGLAKDVTSARKKEWKRLIGMNEMAMPFDVYTTEKKRWFRHIDNRELTEKYSIGGDDAVVFCWGKSDGVQWTLGQMRNLVAEAGGLRAERKITCHWVVSFPLFIEEEGRLCSTHHPFTAAIEGDRERLWKEGEEGLRGIEGQHYDLVINGVEMGGGSIRIHCAEEQRRVLEILGEKSDEMSHLLEALSLGAPPHGGFALGLDRFCALLAAEGDPALPVREVIAFPKSKDGRDLMCGAPVEPSRQQLERYGIEMKGE